LGRRGVRRVERLDDELRQRDVERRAEGRHRAEELEDVVVTAKAEREQDLAGRLRLLARSRVDSGIARELVVQSPQLVVRRELGLPREALEEVTAPLAEIEDARRHSARMQRDPQGVRGRLEQARVDALRQERDATVRGDE